MPSCTGLDYLAFPNGPIQQSQKLASKAFEAKQTWFLVNGTTAGIHAAIMASCRPGDCLLLARNCHQSAFAAAVFAGKHVHRIACRQEVTKFCDLCIAMQHPACNKFEAGYPVVLPSSAHISCCGICQDVTQPMFSQNAIPGWGLHMECALTHYSRHWKLL